MNHLPIDDVTGELLDALRTHKRVVIQAPPGAGKSTRVPSAILDAGLTDKEIVVLEPRRVAARSIARRIAQERGDRVGGKVGWQIRWDRKGSKDTRLWVVTEGILTRRVAADPFLENVGVLILDEFHERSIHTDLALGFAKEIAELRDDLYVVVMSATLDAGKVADFLDAPTVVSKGRMFPVDSTWLDREPDNLERAVRTAVETATSDPDDDGDVLVFLPGMREIDACRAACADIPGVELHRLHSRTSDAEQDAALSSTGPRKVIFATNIAETSLTLPRVTTVIDSGLVRQSRAEIGSGFDRLETAQTSIASAEQRAGRAGRVGPGRAIKLWTRASEFRRRDFDEPAIARQDLCAPVLAVMRWSGAPAQQFSWYETPSTARLDAATATLESIGAVAEHKVTEVGERLLDIPAHPRVARLMLESARNGIVDLGSRVAACLSEQDWVTAVSSEQPHPSDVLLRAELLNEVASGRVQAATRMGLRVNVGAARRAERVARDLARSVTSVTEMANADGLEIERSLCAAFPDRIGFRAAGRRYALASGGSVVLAYESVVRDAEIIVACSVFGSTRTDGVDCAICQQASEVSRDALPQDLFTSTVEAWFDPSLDRLVARRVERFGDFVMSSSPAAMSEANADEASLAKALADAAAADVIRSWGLERDSLRYLQRVDFLRHWMPELELPDPHDPVFHQQLVWGERSFSGLRKKGFVQSYRRCLSGPQIHAIEQHAPEKFSLPKRSFRLDYSDIERPVLAARIQDFFGVRRTPTLADGRATVTLHLLAPNQRPQQVTQDLESFWANTYSEVRKELRARYPKHDWPESPC